MRVVSRFTFILLAALPCACLDMPITSVLDTQARDAGPDPQAACLACIAAPEDPGPGCETPFKACMQDERCAIMMQCAFDAQCLQGSRRSFLACALPCLSKGGVQTSDDSVIGLASFLFQCVANGACGDLCFSGE